MPKTWNASSVGRGVVVGIDGTELSAEALGFAFRTAADRQVPLTAMHAGVGSHRAPGDESAACRAERVLAEALAGWSDEYPDVEVRRLATGQPATLALLAESRAPTY